MKLLLLKIILFIMFIVALVIGNMYVFRSDYPMASFFTFIGSVIILIFIPYNKLFKTNQNEKF